MDQKEILKSVVNDLINDKSDSASVSLHTYLTGKMQDVAGMSKPQVNQELETDTEIADQDDDTDNEDTE